MYNNEEVKDKILTLTKQYYEDGEGEVTEL